MKASRRRLFGLLAGAAAAVGLPACPDPDLRRAAVRSFRRHHTCFDPDGAAPKPLWDVLRWQATRRAAEWPPYVPNPHADTPPPHVNGGQVRLSFMAV